MITLFLNLQVNTTLKNTSSMIYLKRPNKTASEFLIPLILLDCLNKYFFFLNN